MSNNENCIREAAYYLWQNAGCPSGQDERFWSMAVEQISSCSKSTAKKCCKKSCASSSSSVKKTASKSTSKSSSKK